MKLPERGVVIVVCQDSSLALDLICSLVVTWQLFVVVTWRVVMVMMVVSSCCCCC